jgi:hypothetical protein
LRCALIGRSSSTDTEDHEYGTLYNYADDNTLSYVNDNYEKLIDILEKESDVQVHMKRRKQNLRFT